jgi:SAM-dependent methyltransferase
MKRTTKRKKEWFDNDALWRETYPFLFTDARFARAAETVRKALKLGKPRGKSALDLCCGPGRCSVALARRGFTVTGVDRTKFLLDKARARARASGLKVEWIQADMRDFRRANAYDVALSIFTSFGYFEDPDDDVAVLRNIFDSLRPGGVLVVDLFGKENLARSFQPASSSTLPDGSMLLENRRIVDGWSRIANTWTIIRRGRARHFSLNLNLYSGQELRDRLERAGFVSVKLFGDLDGRPYDIDARRLVVVARKPSRHGNRKR